MQKDLDIYHEMGRKIETYIRPATFPLAVRLVDSASEIQPEYKRPLRDMNVQNFLCQNFKMSRSYGWTMAITEEDISCKIARVIYGWDAITDETKEWVNLFSVGLYAKDAEVSEKMQEHLYLIKDGCHGIVISPLTRTKVIPHVVLIYCLPAQAMRLIQGYLYCEGGALEFAAAGRMGSCHEGVVKTFLTGKPQLVIPGNGDRIWGGAQDSEILFACPHDKVETLVEGLGKTHTAGLRYPIPTYMNYSPGFQEAFEEEATRKAGGTLVK
jgi:uncharacterized protein (DUF169 family)